MKLQQLRYILEVYRQNLNVSAAAESLFTSQPGISKQIRLLEEEIGVPIFVRQGRRMAAVTEPGRLILEIAERILREAQNIKKVGSSFAQEDGGILSIAASPCLVDHRLASVSESFARAYPKVNVNIQSLEVNAITQAVLAGDADVGFVAQEVNAHADLCFLPCGHWQYVLIVPFTHDLATASHIGLPQLAQYGLMASSLVKSKNSFLNQAFQAASLPLPHFILCSDNEALIQHHVTEGLGVGLLSAAALPQKDLPFVAHSLTHLFADSPIFIVLSRERYFRDFVYDFISIFAPQLNQHIVNQLLYQPPEEDFSI